MSMREPAEPTPFVLVHSAWAGAWSWAAVAHLLHQRGHPVLVPDLPGHGEDRTLPSQVSMEAYVRSVTRVLEDQREPVILVGHSFGGIVASQAAEVRPEKVKALVYLCGFLLPSGASFVQATSEIEGSLAIDNFIYSEDDLSLRVREEVVHEAFAHDVPPDAFAQGRTRMVPEPAVPLRTPLSLSEERWGSIPRYYIECTEDRAIPPEYQRAMYTATPVERVFSIPTSHVPNFSAPDRVVQYLLEVAAE